MIPLTPEQREYKERTLHQLLANQRRIEASLTAESRPNVIKSIQRQLADIDAHVSRLQDELSGNVVVDEPVADEYFNKAAQALSRGKFYMARRQIKKLETIEPFYPGIDRLKHEADTQQVSRRTKAIAEGKASGYPNTAAFSVAAGPSTATRGLPVTEAGVSGYSDEPEPWYRSLLQFHVLASCFVVLMLMCVVFGMFGYSILQWLVEGSG